MIPLIPKLAMKPGFITKVAALVILAASESATAVGENIMFPTA
jgi:hypothetical protein